MAPDRHLLSVGVDAAITLNVNGEKAAEGRAAGVIPQQSKHSTDSPALYRPWKSGRKNILHTGADLKNVGGPQSYISLGSGWANACNTAFRLYKVYNNEGGVRTPFIEVQLILGRFL